MGRNSHNVKQHRQPKGTVHKGEWGMYIRRQQHHDFPPLSALQNVLKMGIIAVWGGGGGGGEGEGGKRKRMQKPCCTNQGHSSINFLLGSTHQPAHPLSYIEGGGEKGRTLNPSLRAGSLYLIRTS